MLLVGVGNPGRDLAWFYWVVVLYRYTFAHHSTNTADAKRHDVAAIDDVVVAAVPAALVSQ